MITIAIFGAGGLVIAFLVALASVVVKVYASAPPALLATVRHLFDFLFALLWTLLELVYIVLAFLYNVVVQLFGPLSWVFRIVYLVITFYVWACVHVIRGLLGFESSSMNTFSWVVVTSAVFLYLDYKYQADGLDLVAAIRSKLARLLRRNINRNSINNQNDNNNNNNNNLNRNDGPNPINVGEVVPGAAADEIEVVAADPHHQENQLLEIENRENENEENALEEADRNRVNIDNVQNDQRELDRDRVDQQPARQRHFVDLDSSDDDIDPNMCSVCLNRIRGAALFPCGHTYLCRICARIIVSAERPCPICQTPIQEVRNVYV